MTCDMELLTQAYADGELDPPAALSVERHLATCPTCPQLLEDTRRVTAALRADAPYHRAPAHLRSRVLGALDAAEAGSAAGPERLAGRSLGALLSRHRQWLYGALSGGALAGAAVALLLLLVLPQGDDALIVADLVDDHHRSLMADHLTDVVSSNQHTVKPWLSSHLAISPPVPDLAAEGYTLVGGRADVVYGQVAAVTVYRSKGGHIINLFAWHYEKGELPATAERDGYHVMFWRAGDLLMCAVSDMAMPDLRDFVRLVQTASARSGAE